MIWQEILTVISILFIIEVLIPFISPSKYKNFVSSMSKLNTNNLRILGFISMTFGVLLLVLVT